MKSLFGLNYSVQAPEKRSGVFILIGVLLCVQFSLIWPIYPLFGSIHPIVIGIPFSIVWVLICLFVSFFSLLGFYVWEHRNSGNNTLKHE